LIALPVIYGLLSIADLFSTGLLHFLVPLTTALTVVILAGMFQRRISFLQQLRTTWTGLVDAVQDAVQFTELTQPEAPDFAKLMKKLGVAADNYRSLFNNLEGSRRAGWFPPFESLKRLQETISEYYLAADYSDAKQQKACDQVRDFWKQVRSPLLDEFDCPDPPSWEGEEPSGGSFF
jgi:hypothetical protein